jgi:three-Cys-motif partner protein
VDPKNYAGREQALVKHQILRSYLQKLAYKIGHFKPGTTLNYIDGFSGPWDATAEDNSDASPSIAVRELHRAQTALAKKKGLTARAMFVEKDSAAFQRLEALRKSFGIQTEAYCGSFEEHIDHATKFARTGNNAFAFVFIDPTGWTGYGLRRISPLLRVQPSEVLINFMTKDIARFVDQGPTNVAESFTDLFGGDHRDSWRGLKGIDREDAIVQAYCKRVSLAGRYLHVVSAVVRNPQKDRTHYHLVYGTRSDEGLVTFREIEAAAMKLQRRVRAEVRERARTERAGFVGSLFDATDVDSDHSSTLLARYHEHAQVRVRRLLEKRKMISYDEAVLTALQSPMTAEADLRRWITNWGSSGHLKVEGLASRERTPKRKSNHRLRWEAQ